MNMYKAAQQVKFHDVESLREKIQKFRDREYTAYISVLAQVHEEIQDGSVGIDEAIENAAGVAYLRPMRDIISYIGLPTFTNTEFSIINSELSRLRIPVEERGSVKIDDTEEEDVPEVLDVFDLLNLSEEERKAYFQGLNYPEEHRERAFIMIKNLEYIENIYLDQSVPRNQRNSAQGELVSAMTDLLAMSRGEFEIPPGDGEWIPETERIVFPKSEDSEKITSKDSNEPVKSTRKSNRSALVSMSEDDIFDHELFENSDAKERFASNNNPYIDYSVSPPELDRDTMESVFGNFVNSLEKALSKVSVRGGNGKITNEMKKEFNEMAFSIKMADYKTYEDFKERISNSSSDEERKVLESMRDEIKSWLPSQRVVSDEDFGETLYSVSLAIAAPSLAKLIMFGENEALEKVIRNDPKNDHIDSSMIDEIRTAMSSTSRQVTINNLVSYFDLENTYGVRNLLDAVGLRWEYIFKSAVKHETSQSPKVEYRPCPTCHKYIPWNISKRARDTFPGGNSSFSVRLYSFYTGDESRPKVTLEYLNSRSWPAPLPNAYSDLKIEQAKVIGYGKDGEKTWKEIQELLNSNNRSEQEEGWHRRSEALRLSGGWPIGTEHVQVKNIMTECPFSDSGDSEVSGCGISFAPQSVTPLSGGLSLQPSWDGTRTNNVKDQYKSNSLGDDLWENKDLLDQAKRLQRGGYKFSKLNFACTARVKDVTSLTSYKHGNIAISKPGPAGSDNFLYPTNPDGSLDLDIKDGTLAFLVCGAATSLSAYDRSPESTGFILKHFQNIRTSDMGDYRKLMKHLIRQGFTVEETMELDLNLDSYIENASNLNSTAKVRMKKLYDIIKTSEINMKDDSEIRRLLGGLTLVCPFGHRFTIEHSLNFGKKYAGIFNKDSVGSLYRDVITSEGDDNIRSLLKPRVLRSKVRPSNMLVPADHPEMRGFTKLNYDEWVTLENRTVFPIKRDLSRPILIFNLPYNLSGEKKDFVFYEKSIGSKANVWSSERSFLDAKHTVKYVEKNENEKSALSDRSITGAGATSLLDLAQKSNFVIQNANQGRDDYEDYNRPPSEPIPGTLSVYDENENIRPEAFGNKVLHLSRALKSCLRIIKVWTTGVVSDGMMKAILNDRKIDISLYSSRITEPLSAYFDIYKEDDDGEDIPVGYGEQVQLKLLMRRRLIDSINRKGTSMYDYIRANIYSLNGESYEVDIARQIIRSSLLELLDEGTISNEHGSIYLNVKSGDREQFSKKVTEAIISANPDIVREISQLSEVQSIKERRRTEQVGRVALVGYAQYLSRVLSIFSLKYLAEPQSDFYIGYDIKIDLSSSESIIGSESNGEWVGGITEEDIERIPTTMLEALNGRNKLPKVPSGTLRYEDRIDNAWKELEGYLKRARRESMSSRSMEGAKSYIISKLSFMSGKDQKEISKRVSNSFPNKSILFSGTSAKPEMGNSLITKRRLPLLYSLKDKVISILDVPGTKRVEEWVVTNLNTKEVVPFATKIEAENYKLEISKDNQAGNITVMPESYWVNEENGYDGSRSQFGITAKKAGAEIKWPPDPDSFRFVGLNLPFFVKSNSSDPAINYANKIPIPSYRFEIDYDGRPMDISFLLRRGRIRSGKNLSKSESKKADKLSANSMRKEELQVMVAHSTSRNNIRLFKLSNKDAINNDETILTKFISKEKNRLTIEVEPHLRSLDAYPLGLLTTKSYVDPDGMSARPMARVNIEDPIRAYWLIMNSEVRGVSISKEDKDRYIDFIIRVYNIDTIRDLMHFYARKKPLAFSEYKNVTSRELLANPEKYPISRNYLGVSSFENKDGEKVPGYVQSAGDYFSLNPGNNNNNSGSYLQYTYSTSPNSSIRFTKDAHPEIKVLINASRYLKLSGLDQESESVYGSDIGRKIEEDMLEYITSRTSGARENPASDGIKVASEYSKKISLRRSELDRIILSLGIFDFSDVEMPGF